MFGFLQRHKIVAQTWQGETVTMMCKCGGKVIVESAKRAPVYLDAMPIPTEFVIVGTVTDSTCRKYKKVLPVARLR